MLTRRFIIRLSLAVLWVAVGVLLFIFYRGHMLLIDNHDIDEMRASNLISVTVDKRKPLEFFRGDRDQIRVGGSRHRICIEYTDGTPPFKTGFTLPLWPDMYLLSIPRLTSGADNAIEVFFRQRETRNAEEEIPITE